MGGEAQVYVYVSVCVGCDEPLTVSSAGTLAGSGGVSTNEKKEEK